MIGCWLIVEKIKPRRLILEETEEVRSAIYGEYIERLYMPGLNIWEGVNPSEYKYRIWKEVKENDSSAMG